MLEQVQKDHGNGEGTEVSDVRAERSAWGRLGGIFSVCISVCEQE